MEKRYDPYEYIAYRMSEEESSIRERMDITFILMYLRDYEDIDKYDIDYWNKLISYYLHASQEQVVFNSVDELKGLVFSNYKLIYLGGRVVRVDS